MNAAKQTTNATQSERLMTVLLAPVVSEKSTIVADKHDQVHLRVMRDATKPEVKAAVELHVQGARSIVRADRERQGQGEALRPIHRPARQLEEGLCLAEGRARKSTSRRRRPK